MSYMKLFCLNTQMYKHYNFSAMLDTFCVIKIACNFRWERLTGILQASTGKTVKAYQI